MLKRALVPLAFAAAFALAPFSARSMSAWADTPADAGAVEIAPTAEPAAAAQPAAAAPECTYKGEAMPCEQLAARFNENPAEAVSTVRELWKGGGAVPAVLFALFVAVYAASKRFPWLTEGKRAAYTASALGALTILAEPASRGTTPTLAMFVAALGSAILLFVTAGKAKTTGGPAPVA